MTGLRLQAFVLVAALSLGGCFKSTHEYRYRNPSTWVSVSIEAAGKAKPSEKRDNEVYLVGARPRSENGDNLPEDRVRIGSFRGLWAPSSIAWIDATTVNICPLSNDRMALKSASVLITETEKATFQITTDCEAFNRAKQRPAG